METLFEKEVRGLRAPHFFFGKGLCDNKIFFKKEAVINGILKGEKTWLQKNQFQRTWKLPMS